MVISCRRYLLLPSTGIDSKRSWDAQKKTNRSCLGDEIQIFAYFFPYLAFLSYTCSRSNENHSKIEKWDLPQARSFLAIPYHLISLSGWAAGRLSADCRRKQHLSASVSHHHLQASWVMALAHCRWETEAWGSQEGEQRREPTPGSSGSVGQTWSAWIFWALHDSSRALGSVKWKRLFSQQTAGCTAWAKNWRRRLKKSPSLSFYYPSSFPN